MSVQADNPDPKTRLLQLNERRKADLIIVQAKRADLESFLDNPANLNQTQLIHFKLSQLHKCANMIPALNDEILSMLDEESTIVPEVTEAAKIDDQIMTTIARAEVALEQSQPPQNQQPGGAGGQTSTSGMGGQEYSKLPKIDIEPYSGEVLKWQSFWDSFNSAIHSKTNISQINKFIYLRKYLAGEALEAIEGYRVINENYDVAIATLKERFGDPEVAKFAHFEQLLAIKSADNDPSKLKGIYFECEKHIRSLIALGLKEETFGQVFTPIIMSKLPRSTRMQLHRNNSTRRWDLSTLRALMKDEIEARDMSDRFNRDFATKPDSGAKSNNQQGAGASNNNHNKSQHSKQKPNWHTQVNNTATTAARARCPFCNGEHFSSECSVCKTVASRKAKLSGKCFKCFSSQHRTPECPKTKPCFYCGGKSHHSALCFKKFGRDDDSLTNSGSSKTPPPNHTTATHSSDQTPAPKSLAIMKMAMVEFSTPQGVVKARVYLDDGSTATYVRTGLARKLGLRGSDPQYVSVGRLGSSKRKTEQFSTTTLQLPLSDGSTFPMTAFITDVITCPIQKLPLDTTKYQILTHLPLADTVSKTAEMVDIDILIGGDYLHDLLTGERVPVANELYLYGSKLGYVVAGKQESHFQQQDLTSTVLFAHTTPTSAVSENLERFWALEDLGIKDNPSIDDDEEAMRKFNSSVSVVDGRYEVGLPWKEDPPQLESNYGLSLGRLKSLLARLQQHQTLLDQYNATIKDQLTNGVIERITDSTESGICHYIPHHCVIRDDHTTTKLRVVYDGSAKARRNSRSLNDCLYRGPVILQDLCGILMRFRLSNIALTCDVEKAFLQVGIREQDRDALRFLWVTDPSFPANQNNIQIFRFCRVPFGLVCSPFLLAATVMHFLRSHQSINTELISRNLYVDNVAVALENDQLAKSFFEEAVALFASKSMNLRCWQSNDSSFRTAVPDHLKSPDPITKVLGLHWQCESDFLTCGGPKAETQEVQTKRELLSELSKVFDPCGFVCPVVITAKIIVQDLWRNNVPWDQLLDENSVACSVAVIKDLSRSPEILIPRRLNSLISAAESVHELHCFCDASARAFAAAAYVRSSLLSGQTDTGLIFAKARLAPVKEALSIPRLELLAAVIACRLSKFVLSQTDGLISRVVIWTDSKCVLQWIKTEKSLKVFVSNKVREIKSHDSFQFRHVPTSCNPADLPSRGVDISTLKDSSLWWKGPSFLCLPETMWPENLVITNLPDAETEREILGFHTDLTTTVMPKIQHLNPKSSPDLSLVINPSDFSSWFKLVRITVFVLRFIGKLPRPKLVAVGKRDFVEASKMWLKWAQEDLHDQLKKSSYSDLKPVKDEEGLIRCHGRLEHSDLSLNQKFPVLLPKNHVITTLIVVQSHEVLAHAGTTQTLAHVRFNYWVPHGKSQVHRIISKCQACRRMQGGSFKLPESPSLPDYRVTETAAFSNVGVDYFGPLLVRSDADTTTPKKVWICLMTCCVTRAVHLDLVQDLSGQQFMLCFRRFVAIHTMPSLIVSDNARQFQVSNAVMQTAFESVSRSQSGHGLKWKFITELAPWMGGMYERQVGTVKRALRKTIGLSRLTASQLQTLIFEIATVVNSRPLVVADASTEDLTLSPAHFISLSKPRAIPQIHDDCDDYTGQDQSDTQKNLLLTWKRGQRLLNIFWNVWRDQYLASLRERPAVNFGQRNTSEIPAEIGAVVTIKDDMPRSQWKLGIIEVLHESDDGAIRSATVRTANGSRLKRSLKLLYPIEYPNAVHPANNDRNIVDFSQSSDVPNSNQSASGDHRAKRSSPRMAAVKARENIRANLQQFELDDQ